MKDAAEGGCRAEVRGEWHYLFSLVAWIPPERGAMAGRQHTRRLSPASSHRKKCRLVAVQRRYLKHKPTVVSLDIRPLPDFGLPHLLG